MKLKNNKVIWKIFEKYFANNNFEFMDMFGKLEVDTEKLKTNLHKCILCCRQSIKEIESLEKKNE